MAKKLNDVFISSSRADYFYVSKITRALDNIGITYLMDYSGYHAEGEFTESFKADFNACSLFLFFISDASMASEQRLQSEIQYAIQQNKKILPIRIGNAGLFASTALKLPLGVKSLDLSHITDENLIETCFLTALSELMGTDFHKGQYDIFISYKRDNKELVFPIKDRIEQKTGKKCWIDIDGIESDAQFASVIIKAINNAKILLFMYSHLHTEIEDFDSDWTVREITFAQKKKKRIVFLNIDGAQLTDWFELFFGNKQQIDISSDVAMEKLYRDIREWLK